MGKIVDLETVHKMEEEARQLERTGDHLSALDIYEELSRSRWASAKHLTQLGSCYRQARQMQDAKKAWLRAISMDPNYQPCRNMLNQYFVGWESQVPKEPPPPPADDAPPPPPPANLPPAAKGPELSGEMVVPSKTRPSFAMPSEPEPIPEPVRPLAPEPKPELKLEPVAKSKPAEKPKSDTDSDVKSQTDTDSQTGSRSKTTIKPRTEYKSKTAEYKSKTQHGSSTTRSDATKTEKAASTPVEGDGENRVNWEYVLMDAAEEVSARR